MHQETEARPADGPDSPPKAKVTRSNRVGRAILRICTIFPLRALYKIRPKPDVLHLVEARPIVPTSEFPLEIVG